MGGTNGGTQQKRALRLFNIRGYPLVLIGAPGEIRTPDPLVRSHAFMFPAIQRLFRPEMRWAWRELEKYIDGKVNRALEVLAMILVAYDGALADPGRRQDEIRRCRAIAEKARELGELIAATDMDKRYRGQLAWTHSWGVIPRPPHTLRALRPEIGTFLSREGRLGDSPGDALSTLIGLGVAEVADLQARVEEKLARLVPSPGVGKASRERTAFIRLLGMHFQRVMGGRMLGTLVRITKAALDLPEEVGELKEKARDAFKTQVPADLAQAEDLLWVFWSMDQPSAREFIQEFGVSLNP